MQAYPFDAGLPAHLPPEEAHMRMPATSVEYIRALVTADVDVSALPVEMAVTAGSLTPSEDDWESAAWDGLDARLLVGPLTIGTYMVWVRVTSTPEIPVMRAGQLIAY
jgi:hypothetical protein